MVRNFYFEKPKKSWKDFCEYISFFDKDLNLIDLSSDVSFIGGQKRTWPSLVSTFSEKIVIDLKALLSQNCYNSSFSTIIKRILLCQGIRV